MEKIVGNLSEISCLDGEFLSDFLEKEQNMENYELKSLCLNSENEDCYISNGSYGRIYEISNKYVMKVCNFHSVSFSEIFILSNLSNECVLRSRLIFKNRQKIYMVIPKYTCTLSEFSTDSEEIKLDLTKQITSGLSYIHSKNFLHLDMSTNNILIKHSNKLQACICDFSFSRFTLSGTIKSKSPKITVGFRPYENLKGSVLYSRESDMWSLGMCLYRLWHGKEFINFTYVPEDYSSSFLYELSARFEIEKSVQQFSWPPSNNQLINGLLNIDKNLRFNMEILCFSLNLEIKTEEETKIETINNVKHWKFVSNHFSNIEKFLVSRIEKMFNKILDDNQKIQIEISDKLQKHLFLCCVLYNKLLISDLPNVINSLGIETVENIFDTLCLFLRK